MTTTATNRIVDLLAQYQSHLASHPGDVRRADAMQGLSVEVGTLRAYAGKDGIGYSRKSGSCTWTCLQYLSTQQIADLHAEIGAENLALLQSHVEAARAFDRSEQARVARESARLQAWVSRREQLRSELQQAMQDCPVAYVREGKVAAGHHSYNYCDNFQEAGCSVFAARRFKGVCYIVDVCASNCWFSPDHVCEGDRLPVNGSDDEPLIAVTKCRRARQGEVVML